MLKIRKVRGYDKYSVKWYDKKGNITLLSEHDSRDDAIKSSVEVKKKIEERIKTMKDDEDDILVFDTD